jgi:hypothetical protein
VNTNVGQLVGVIQHRTEPQASAVLIAGSRVGRTRAHHAGSKLGDTSCSQSPIILAKGLHEQVGINRNKIRDPIDEVPQKVAAHMPSKQPPSSLRKECA